MPAAVAKYVDTNSYLEVDSVLSELKQTYIDDFVKYKVQSCFAASNIVLVWLIKGSKFVFSQSRRGIYDATSQECF